MKIFTVATDITKDGFLRFNRSASVYGLKVDVLGSGTKWMGGDVNKYPGGGQKVLLLREALKKYSHDPNLAILFVDR